MLDLANAQLIPALMELDLSDVEERPLPICPVCDATVFGDAYVDHDGIHHTSCWESVNIGGHAFGSGDNP